MSTTPEAIKGSPAFAVGQLAKTLDTLAEAIESVAPLEYTLIMLIGKAQAQRDEVSRAIMQDELVRSINLKVAESCDRVG